MPQVKIPRHIRLVYRKPGEMSHAADAFLAVAKAHPPGGVGLELCERPQRAGAPARAGPGRAADPARTTTSAAHRGATRGAQAIADRRPGPVDRLRCRTKTPQGPSAIITELGPGHPTPSVTPRRRLRRDGRASACSDGPRRHGRSRSAAWSVAAAALAHVAWAAVDRPLPRRGRTRIATRATASRARGSPAAADRRSTPSPASVGRMARKRERGTDEHGSRIAECGRIAESS